jgi:ribosomal protein S19
VEKKEKIKKLQKDIFKRILKIDLNFFIRDSIIFNKYMSVFSFFIGKSFYIYNGTAFRKISVSVFLICMRFGFFVFTRKPFKYLLKKKKR